MKWLKHIFGRAALAEAWVLPQMKFVAEQDGPCERDVKARWKSVLRHHSEVQRAYLVLAEYSDGQSQPVLCIRSSRDKDVSLIDELAVPFKDIFASDCALDMMFLSAEKEKEVRDICSPFYDQI
jgi:type III secretion system (T3SS) SseB-like protein